MIFNTYFLVLNKKFNFPAKWYLIKLTCNKNESKWNKNIEEKMINVYSTLKWRVILEIIKSVSYELISCPSMICEDLHYTYVFSYLNAAHTQGGPHPIEVLPGSWYCRTLNLRLIDLSVFYVTSAVFQPFNDSVNHRIETLVVPTFI